MRVACVDIGTNSVLLLIAESSDSDPKTVYPLAEKCTITRLGQGVDRTGVLAPEAIARTVDCVRQYAALIEQAGAERVAVVGTSAARDAKGADAFVQEVEKALGTRPQVISGEREAELTFSGALAGLDLLGPVGVFDIGGGSTEIVQGEWKGPGQVQLERAVSLQLGSVRLTERVVQNDPPTASELDAIRHQIGEKLSALPSPDSSRAWVGIAGTVTTLAAIELALDPYDAEQVHGMRMSRQQVTRLVERLASMPLPLRQTLRGLEPKRADVIIAGAVLIEQILHWAGAAQMIVSDRGVRWGLAFELLGPR